MRRRTFLGNRYTIAGGNVTASTAVAGDVCLYQKGTNNLVIIPQNTFDVKTYPLDSYTPVGVVVVPGSHDVYGDGSCGVISLKFMSCNTPDNGTIENEDIRFGGTYYDISSISYTDSFGYVGSNGNISNTIQGYVDECALFPTDESYGIYNPYDTDTNYDSTSSYHYVPSPYNNDDSRNRIYPFSVNSGKYHTQIITQNATAQSDWKTASSITNTTNGDYYPAACCCWRYHTDGTKQGDWYLPSLGELGYMMVKYNKINKSINKLNSYFSSNNYILVDDYTKLWSSTPYNTYKTNFICGDSITYNIYEATNTYAHKVLAFLRVK